MLPSFRLIAAAFLCGFVVVFVGLRLVVSLHTIHKALPVAAAHAATLAPAGPQEWPVVPLAAPVRFDLRFVTGTSVASAPVSLAPLAIQREALLPSAEEDVAGVPLPGLADDPPQALLAPEPEPAATEAEPAVIASVAPPTADPAAAPPVFSGPALPVPFDTTDPEPIEPDATATVPAASKAVVSAPKAKSKTARNKRSRPGRTAARDSFGAPFGNSNGISNGTWPKQQ